MFKVGDKVVAKIDYDHFEKIHEGDKFRITYVNPNGSFVHINNGTDMEIPSAVFSLVPDKFKSGDIVRSRVHNESYPPVAIGQQFIVREVNSTHLFLEGVIEALPYCWFDLVRAAAPTLTEHDRALREIALVDKINTLELLLKQANECVAKLQNRLDNAHKTIDMAIRDLEELRKC